MKIGYVTLTAMNKYFFYRDLTTIVGIYYELIFTTDDFMFKQIKKCLYLY